jgi:hypothetical protein
MRDAFRIAMLPAIQFHDQIPFATDKIHNVARHRMLPAKPKPADLAVAQQSPKSLLGVRGLLAHPLGETL